LVDETSIRTHGAARSDAYRGFGGVKPRTGTCSEHGFTEKAEGRYPTPIPAEGNVVVELVVEVVLVEVVLVDVDDIEV
jgi:hypothetical protein